MASYSILTIQLLVVCLTLVRWPTTVTAKELTSRQKEKPHGKKNNLTAKRTEKTRGKKKNLTAKRKRLKAKIRRCREDILILISFAVRSWLFFLPWVVFFLPWGFSFCGELFLFVVRLFFLPWSFSFCREVNSFCREVILFAVRFFFLPWG